MGLRALATALFFHDAAGADVGIGEEHVERVPRIQSTHLILLEVKQRALPFGQLVAKHQFF